ncbi:MAG: transcriptional regulator [Bacteroidia bacterium]|nr:transcriptional regulator [Bacteroidia bacterium]
MADNTKLQRSLRILLKLAREREVTVNDLYDFFDGEITRRTIQRTLSDLSSANIPIVSRRGAHNEYHYSLERAFDHIPETLTADETLAAVLLSQSAGIFQGTRIGEDINAVFAKLEQLLPSGALAVPSAFTGEQYVYNYQPGRALPGGYAEALHAVFRGILSGRVCRVQYRDKRYLFHPYSLLLYGGALYVVGKQPRYGNLIYLAMNRMKAAELLDQTFERDPDFNLQNFLAGNFGIWYEKPEDVRIRFDATVRPSVEDRQWHASQRIEALEDGGVILSMRVGPSLELVAWILRWGAHAEVLEPATLRREIRKTASAVAKMYRKG